MQEEGCEHGVSGHHAGVGQPGPGPLSFINDLNDSTGHVLIKFADKPSWPVVRLSEDEGRMGNDLGKVETWPRRRGGDGGREGTADTSARWLAH